jgi:hypothetical protein
MPPPPPPPMIFMSAGGQKRNKNNNNSKTAYTRVVMAKDFLSLSDISKLILSGVSLLNNA